MAAADILTRLLLNTTDFDQKLGKSKKEVDSWSKQMVGMGSVAGGAMKGIAGAAGLAFGAMETFDRIIKANETNNDKWENTMRAVNNSVNEFFSALTSGDFTTFQNGLEGIIQKARDTAEALRQVEDAQTVFGLFSSRNQAEFDEGMVTLRDKNATPEARNSAMETMQAVIDRQTEESKTVEKKAIEAVRQLVTQRGPLDASMVSENAILNALHVVLEAGGQQKSEELERRYKEYRKLLDERIKHYQYDLGYRPEVYLNSYDITGLKDEYFDAILNDLLWNKTNGEGLNEVTSLFSLASQMRSKVASMQRTFNRAKQSSAITDTVNTKEPAEGSIAYLQEELKKAQDAVINATDETARITAQKTVNELKEQIQGLTVWAETQAALQQGNLGTYVFGDNYGIDEEAINKVPEFKDEIDLKDSKIEVPELPDQSDNIQETTDALGVLAGAISNITGLVDSGAAAWASYFGNIIQTVGQAIPLIDALTNSQNQAAAAEGKKAAMGAGSSVSNIPVVGPILAVAAIASVVAALASIPKFAEGGIVGGSSYYGDKILARLNSGEMVLNQRQQARLLDSIERPQQNIHITGKLTAEGRDLSIVLSDYNIYRRQ